MTAEATAGTVTVRRYEAEPMRRYEAEALRRYEQLLIVPRAALGLVGLPLLAVVIHPRWPVEMAVAAVLLVGGSGYAHRRLRGDAGGVLLPQLRRLCRLTLAVDVAAALVVLVALASDPVSPAAILLPLVVFEAALKLGRAGLALGGVLLAVAVGVRALQRSASYGLPPRYPLIMLIVSASGLLAGLAMALRGEERARQATALERDRIRQAFRETVEEALRNAGVAQVTLDGSDLDDLVQLACQETRVGPVVGQRLAQLLAPDPGLAALTRREREIVELFARGRSDREIAAELVVSAVTVRVHLSNAMAKLGVAGRCELMARLGRSTVGPAAEVR